MAYSLKPRSPRAIAMVRAGEKAHLYEWCRENSHIVIGWFWNPPQDLGEWSLGKLEARFRAGYPVPTFYKTKTSQTSHLNHVADFLFSLPVGRKVMIASPGGGHTLLFGEVVGGYEIHTDWGLPRPKEYDPYYHCKRVRWIGEFARGELVEAANLPWTDQSTVWWVEDAAAIRDLEAAAANNPVGSAADTAEAPPKVAEGTGTGPTELPAQEIATFTPLMDKAEISEAYARFVGRLTDGVAPIRKGLGWRSGWSEFDVYWHPAEQVWCVLEPEFAETRYWCCFGPDDPTGPHDLSISCEINFAYEGVNRRIAGAFVKDDEGRVYVAHSGKVGGGHEGVGKEAFLKYVDSPVRAAVAWPDGQKTEMLILGMLDSSDFVRNVATFVSEVASFKEAVREGRTADRDLPPTPGEDYDSDLGDYFPESLLGVASFDQKTRKIEIRLAHGPVVHALRDAIEGAGFVAKKNNRIDLAAVTAAGEIVTVFEVKTSVDWGSVYGAIGQLMYYGKTGAHSPKRLVAVLPTGGPADLDSRLATIGLGVVRYQYDKGLPVFEGLELALSTSG